MTEKISLLDQIKAGGHQASLIATYNAYLPFYEEVVRPHLTASGCRHNLVMMDAHRCSETLSDQGSRPRSAGRLYSLIPVKIGGAFHPKILLLVGRNKGTLLVGSHNLTLSGYGSNRELTNKFEYIATRERKQLQGEIITLQRAYQFLKSYADGQPEIVQEMFEVLERQAPWLREPHLADTDTPFIGSSPSGEALWEIIQRKLPAKARRIFVIGPFFDAKLIFLQQLSQGLNPQELIIGIEPELVEITSNARQLLPQARFVNAEVLREGRGYLHAKAILIEATNGQELLITGSANPSSPAWLAAPDKRNAEAVIIRSNVQDEVIADLKLLADQPELTDLSWEVINNRQKITASNDPQAPTIVLATAVGDSFAINILAETEPIDEAHIFDGQGKLLGTLNGVIYERECLRIPITDVAWYEAASWVELSAGGIVKFRAIIHHLEELTNLGRTTTQRALHDSLATLTGESPKLDEVLKIINKVIFAEADEPTSEHPDSSSQRNKNDSSCTSEISQFEISIAATQTVSRKKRFYAEGDLGLILNALIQGLGKGLYGEPQEQHTVNRSEEELVGSEDDELLQPPRVDGVALVQLCQQKIKTMFRRMVKQYAIAKAENKPLKAMIQLAAVLALIRYLRCEIEGAAWVPPGESLLPPIPVLRKFFLESCHYLYSPTKALLQSAITDLGEEECSELIYIRGFLAWLAWECKFDARLSKFSEGKDEKLDEVRALDRLLQLIPDLMNDGTAIRAVREVRNMDPKFLGYENWLYGQVTWYEEIEEVAKPRLKLVQESEELNLGDIVYRKTDKSPYLTTVLEIKGRNVKLAENETTWYRVNFLNMVQPMSAKALPHQRNNWTTNDWKRVLGG